MSDLYRASLFHGVPLGADLQLIYLKHIQSPRLLAPNELKILEFCREFRTLENHMRELGKAMNLDPSKHAALKGMLTRFVESGLFVSYDELFSGSEPPGLPEDNRKITSLGMVTCDRPLQMECALVSYIENCRRFQRDPCFIILDDSKNPEAAELNYSKLKLLKERYQVSVKYGGLKEKELFANRLIRDVGLPREIVRFSLFDVEKIGISVGANRNAMLLDTFGEFLFTVDDDTLCRITPHPESVPHLSFYSESDPTELWFFDNREAALRSFGSIEEDFLGLHEKILGRPLRSVINEFACVSDIIIDKSLCDHFLKSLLSGKGEITVTFNGLIGDSGLSGNVGYLMGINSDSHQRLAQSEDYYRQAMSSHEVMRAARSISVYHGSQCMTGFMGLDNRDLRPPFPPVGRAEDAIFGLLLSTCFEDSYFGHLPWAMLHSPENHPPRPDVLSRLKRCHLAEPFQWCLMNYNGLAGQRQPEDRLRFLGRYLTELGSLPTSDFGENLRFQSWQFLSRAISGMENRLRLYRNSPQFWRDDLEKCVGVMKQSALDADYIIPAELRNGRTTSEALALLQRLFLNFGHLLQLWPDIVAGAVRLRSQGQGLTREV